jgi:hypothetical protein
MLTFDGKYLGLGFKDCDCNETSNHCQWWWLDEKLSSFKNVENLSK